MRKEDFTTEIKVNGESLRIYSLKRLENFGLSEWSVMPFSIKILLENLLRNLDGFVVSWEDVVNLYENTVKKESGSNSKELPFYPSRVLLQDFTGVPVIVDLATMRAYMKRLGFDPSLINPVIPVDLVIDHSIQVDYYGEPLSFLKNLNLEYERNRERYSLLKWAQRAIKNLRVIPPGKGICHQINMEYLTQVVIRKDDEVYPDTLIGTDSHTTMVNGLGVLGWGVGGIEALTVALGEPYSIKIPEVVGVKLIGELPSEVTATDLVLYITEILRKRKVVDKFVEFFGPALRFLSVPDRATISNMAPEYGATCGFFPPDSMTLDYLRLTGKSENHISLVERYLKEQGIFLEEYEKDYHHSEIVEINLEEIPRSVSGPRRPHDRVDLRDLKRDFLKRLKEDYSKDTEKLPRVEVNIDGKVGNITHGSVVIGAITSCTNTSNPKVMLGAGILAKKAYEKGLSVPSYVKTSLAPGSQVVTEYLKETGLLNYLEKLGFYLVGYGCTTCIGNSGPLNPEIERSIQENDLIVASVLSGNRNFEARIHPLVKANYLMSPILVVAFSIKGSVIYDPENEPLGWDKDGNPVYLKDVWPTKEEIDYYLVKAMKPEYFLDKYEKIMEGDELWNEIPVKEGEIFEFDEKSTYIREAPFFQEFTIKSKKPEDIKSARVLVYLGDSITTDHISPAGSIRKDSPAGIYLISHGVEPKDFNTYGSRRGNHEVMIRGTFANVRLKNKLAEGKEGGYTRFHPTGEIMWIYDAHLRYTEMGVPLLVIAGKEYGSGSSRDWAAKGTYLLGIKAVIAESFERIHRSNLIAMGVLPLQFMEGENPEKLGIRGDEEFDIVGISEGLYPGKVLIVRAKSKDGVKEFHVKARLDTPIEVKYYENGGILFYVLRKIIGRVLK